MLRQILDSSSHVQQHIQIEWLIVLLLQSGCCKPPTECGYTFVNPTYWISPISITADTDCVQWTNEQTALCYSCNSCKAGLLANLRREWRRADLILVVAFAALAWVYVMGCYAFRSAKTDELFRRYKQGYTWEECKSRLNYVAVFIFMYNFFVVLLLVLRRRFGCDCVKKWGEENSWSAGRLGFEIRMKIKIRSNCFYIFIFAS